jgi:hypothetical protein
MLSFTFFYKNGQTLTLSDKLSYDNIPRIGLHGVSVSKDDKEFFKLYLESDQKIIYRRRVILRTGQEPFPIYIMGWRNDKAKSLNFINEEGIVYQMGEWREAPFHQVVFMGGED